MQQFLSLFTTGVKSLQTYLHLTAGSIRVHSEREQGREAGLGLGVGGWGLGGGGGGRVLGAGRWEGGEYKILGGFSMERERDRNGWGWRGGGMGWC